MNIRYYETIIIFTPLLSEKQIISTYNEYKEYLLHKNIEIIKVEIWGLQKLAYSINKVKNGYFYLLVYKTKTKFIKIFNVKILQDDRIIRYLTVKLNKYAIEYLNKKKDYEKK
ncbi:MAG: 30S ribosomal protein S6 [Candidatus Shikimatogenerans bostrichidophilus]|nr:MAG: 30S ribosomal protein S6 [Candidatus Shikimatogenerans bostrichidophilus]